MCYACQSASNRNVTATGMDQRPRHFCQYKTLQMFNIKKKTVPLECPESCGSYIQNLLCEKSAAL